MLILRAQASGDVWAGSTALAIAVGPASDELRYLKSITLHLYLFGYELPGERRQITTTKNFADVHCQMQNRLDHTMRKFVVLLPQTPCSASRGQHCMWSPAARRVRATFSRVALHPDLSTTDVHMQHAHAPAAAT
jgi:FACT complex subunit SPT16 N-terminal lobe domain